MTLLAWKGPWSTIDSYEECSSKPICCCVFVFEAKDPSGILRCKSNTDSALNSEETTQGHSKDANQNQRPAGTSQGEMPTSNESLLNR